MALAAASVMKGAIKDEGVSAFYLTPRRTVQVWTAYCWVQNSEECGQFTVGYRTVRCVDSLLLGTEQ